MCRIVLNDIKDLFPIPFKNKENIMTETFESFGDSMRSGSSQRSKFVSNSKLTKSNLFHSVSCKKSKRKEEKSQEMSLHLGILEDSLALINLNRREFNMKFRK